MDTHTSTIIICLCLSKSVYKGYSTLSSICSFLFLLHAWFSSTWLHSLVRKSIPYNCYPSSVTLVSIPNLFRYSKRSYYLVIQLLAWPVWLVIFYKKLYIITCLEIWLSSVHICWVFLSLLTVLYVLTDFILNILHPLHSFLSFLLANLFILRQAFIKRLLIRGSSRYIAIVNKKRRS